VNAALTEVITTAGCYKRYGVEADLFGTLAFYNASASSHPEHLHDTTTQPLAWLTGPSGLEDILNDEEHGCCSANVSTMGECMCRIAFAVGLIDNGTNYMEPVPPSKYFFAVIRANTTNETSGDAGEADVLVPTWANLFDVMEATFEYTSVTLGGNVSACSPSEAVRNELAGSTYTELVANHRAEFAAFGATEDGCLLEGGELEAFALQVARVCDDPVLTRLYLCTFLDANPLFLGTGVTSGGVKEFITIPNPDVAALAAGAAELSILHFELPKGEPFSCVA